ncbi:MAG: PKD domain-containing protein [Bacteroidetes bacterium]|nr:MAG: PKD domain-containing protein [Bacteroidota bacterium]
MHKLQTDILSCLAAISLLLLHTGCIKQWLTPTPQASFSYEVNEGTREVSFSNNSTQADSYEWDFGDGATSGRRSPQHRYDFSGTYRVTLKARNGDKSDTYSQRVEVGGGQCPPLSDGNTCDKTPASIGHYYQGRVGSQSRQIQRFSSIGKTATDGGGGSRVKIIGNVLKWDRSNGREGLKVLRAHRFGSPPSASQVNNLFRPGTYAYSNIRYSYFDPFIQAYVGNQYFRNGVVVEFLSTSGRYYSSALGNDNNATFEITARAGQWYEARFSCRLYDAQGYSLRVSADRFWARLP